jgi:hypothetical protein
MRRLLLSVLWATAALVAAAATAASAPAPAGTASFVPNAPGAGAHLLIDAQGDAGGGFHRQEIPTGMAIALQRGFTVSPGAVPGVCSDDLAGKDQCPPNAIVGTGTLDVLAEGFAFGAHGQHFTAQLTFYRAQPRQPGDPMGIVFSFRETSSGFHGATIGRVYDPGDPLLGLEAKWDHLPIPQLPPGLHFTIERVRADIGAGTATPPVRVRAVKKHRRCRKVVRRTKSGHRKTVFVCPKKKRRSHAKSRAGAHAAQAAPQTALLTNPPTCSGSWRVRLELTYANGVEQRDADAPCAPAS